MAGTVEQEEQKGRGRGQVVYQENNNNRFPYSGFTGVETLGDGVTTGVAVLGITDVE